MPDVPFPNDSLGNGFAPNGVGPNGVGPVLPQSPVVLSPQQHAVLQALAQHIAALTPNPSPGGRGAPGSTPATPRYEVVKHPSAPKRFLYAIKDHATGGYVTGNSPHFPLIFSTAAEAHENIPSDETLPANHPGLQSVLSSCGLEDNQEGDWLRSPLGFAPSHSLLTQAERNGSAIPPHPLPGNTVQTQRPAPAASPRVEVRVNPYAPARLPYGRWDNEAQDWVRGAHGFALGFGTPAEAEQKLPATQPAPAAMFANAAGMQPHSLASGAPHIAPLPNWPAGARPQFDDGVYYKRPGVSGPEQQLLAQSQPPQTSRLSNPLPPASHTHAKPGKEEANEASAGSAGEKNWTPQGTGWQRKITATVFGGSWDNEFSAYNDRMKITDQTLGASLPGFARGKWVEIVNPANGKTVTVPVVDKGPHFTEDPYWETGRRPRAESDKGSNIGGIDLTPAANKALGFPYGRVLRHGKPVRYQNGNYATYGGGVVYWRFVPAPKGK